MCSIKAEEMAVRMVFEGVQHAKMIQDLSRKMYSIALQVNVEASNVSNDKYCMFSKVQAAERSSSTLDILRKHKTYKPLGIA